MSYELEDKRQSSEALKELLRDEYEGEQPLSVDVIEEDGRYFFKLEDNFDPYEFEEYLEDADDLEPDWVSREDGEIGVLKLKESPTTGINRGTYGTVFHPEQKIALGRVPVDTNGDPVDDTVAETIELVARYLEH